MGKVGPQGDDQPQATGGVKYRRNQAVQKISPDGLSLNQGKEFFKLVNHQQQFHPFIGGQHPPYRSQQPAFILTDLGQ